MNTVLQNNDITAAKVLSVFAAAVKVNSQTIISGTAQPREIAGCVAVMNRVGIDEYAIKEFFRAGNTWVDSQLTKADNLLKADPSFRQTVESIEADILANALGGSGGGLPADDSAKGPRKPKKRNSEASADQAGVASQILDIAAEHFEMETEALKDPIDKEGKRRRAIVVKVMRDSKLKLRVIREVLGVNNDMWVYAQIKKVGEAEAGEVRALQEKVAPLLEGDKLPPPPRVPKDENPNPPAEKKAVRRKGRKKVARPEPDETSGKTEVGTEPEPEAGSEFRRTAEKALKLTFNEFCSPEMLVEVDCDSQAIIAQGVSLYLIAGCGAPVAWMRKFFNTSEERVYRGIGQATILIGGNPGLAAKVRRIARALK